MTTMGTIYHLGVERFVRLAEKAGWEFCGVQESIPPVLPLLVIQKWGITKRLPFDPNDFDPIKTATLYFAPMEKNMTETPKLNLRQKLIQIYNELDHVDKAGDNKKQNYKFVRAADVMRPVRAMLAKLGIYAETNFEYIGSYDIKTNNGGNMHTASVKAIVRLFDADSDETKTISGLGDGADGGDKGIFKAQTGALKNALRNGTLLPDEGDPNGGDPEADQNVDDQTDGAYTHPASTADMPDFQDSQRGPAKSEYSASRPTIASAPKTEAKSGATNAAGSPATVFAPAIATPSTTKASLAESESATSTTNPNAAPEHGDAYEGPDDDGSLPTEAELTEYRSKFKILGDDLSAKGKLKSSQGLPINRKLLVFLISITKVTDAKTITKAQWDNFFKRVDAATANAEVGLVGLAKLVNKANGIEPKK